MSRLESFKNTLEEEYQFPAEYKFKFIVASESISKVLHLIPNSDYSKRESMSWYYGAYT